MKCKGRRITSRNRKMESATKRERGRRRTRESQEELLFECGTQELELDTNRARHTTNAIKQSMRCDGEKTRKKDRGVRQFVKGGEEKVTLFQRNSF